MQLGRTWRQLLAQLGLAGWARALLEAEHLSLSKWLQSQADSAGGITPF